MHKSFFSWILILLVLQSCSQPQASDIVSVQQTEPEIHVVNESVRPDSTSSWTIAELTGHFDPAVHPDFKLILASHTSKPNIYMRKQAYDAFERMYEAAKKEGVKLIIISATRNFDYQKGIWEKKWKREKYKGWSDVDKVRDILTYSSMPGTSRHHWGTDVDFNSVDPSFFTSGEGKKLYEWLQKHGSEYGFAQTYTNKNSGRTGYEVEKWHWSYMPLAGEMLKAYNETVKYSDLSGFHGYEQAAVLKVFDVYVNGIDASLK